MAYWLFKSEPDVFSFDDLIARGETGEEWDGVRNYQARNNMRAMKKGERGIFYHSNIGKECVGIVEVVAEAHPDSKAADSKWECVDIKAIKARLEEMLDERNATLHRGYDIRFSIGQIDYDTVLHGSIEELLVEAQTVLGR